jgi:hypothetical protein
MVKPAGSRVGLSLFAVLALAACPDPTPPQAPVATVVQNPVARVIALDPDTRTAIVGGPVFVSSINPGGDLELALVNGDTCGGDEVWFTYSGGGVAVPPGQTLCARSHADAKRVHAFSGR